MLFFTVRRMAHSFPMLLLLSLLVFSLFKLIPGDYLSEMELNPSISQDTVEKLRSEYGLEDPVWRQYFNWVGQTLTGNLGYSFAQHRPAATVIMERLQNTLVLAIAALLLSLALALPAAVWSALHFGDWEDRLILWATLLGLSVPTLLAALLGLLLAFWIPLLPLGGTGGLRHLFLPSLTLALPSAAFLARTLRLQLLAELSQPYVRASRARGVPHWRTLLHALRNALNPIISLVGLLLGALLGGSVVVEKVFNWPGLGALTVSAILERDLFVALNSVLLAALMTILANLASDILLALNDPRVRTP